MAGGKNSKPPEPVDPAVEEQWRLSRREDLADAFGLVLSIPWHGQDDQGEWRFGLTPMGGMPNMEWQSQFESEMKLLIRDTASGLVSRGLLTENQAASLDYHPYSVGPAAQEWPKIFFDLYQDARPFLADGASLLGWGYFFRDTITALWTWASKKEREQSEYPDAESVTFMGYSAKPSLTLTGPAVVALCYADLVERHGISEPTTIETFPRGLAGYETPGHPGGGETYLLRFRVGRRNFFYYVSGTGKVTEHFLMVGTTLSLLPLPDFLEPSSSPSIRPPAPANKTAIKVS